MRIKASLRQGDWRGKPVTGGWQKGASGALLGREESASGGDIWANVLGWGGAGLGSFSTDVAAIREPLCVVLCGRVALGAVGGAGGCGWGALIREAGSALPAFRWASLH